MRCLELLGKTHGISVEKHEVDHGQSVDVAGYIRDVSEGNAVVAAALIRKASEEGYDTTTILDDVAGDDAGQRAEIEAALAEKSGAVH